MKHREGKLTGLGGLELFWQAWLPQEQRANVLLVHGYGEHSSRYDNVVQTLVPAGFAIWALDHRGHGRSQGLLGHVDCFSDYVADLHTLVTEVVQPTLPTFILGHSMGSIIAINYVVQHQQELAGCILSGTGTDLPPQSQVLTMMMKAFNRLGPKVRIKFPLPPDFISRDPEVVAAYKADPLVHDRISFRLGIEMGRALREGVSKFQMTQLPVLIQCGSMDESFIGQQQLYESLETGDKTLKIYQGLRHEVYNELEPDLTIVLTDLLQWLERHM